MSRRCDKRRKSIDKLKAKEVIAEEIRACEIKSKVLETQKTNTEQLFINNKLFPSTAVPLKITNDTVMPITQAGTYILGENITKTVEIEGENIVINLANLNIIAPSGCGLLIKNSNKIYVYDGFIESTAGTAVYVENSYNISFRSVNTRQSSSGYLVKTTDVLFFQNIFVQGITDYAFDFSECSSLYMGQINISDVTTYTQSLFKFFQSDILYLTKISFLDIVVNDLGVKYGMFLDNCFDSVIDNISFYRSGFTTNSGDLLVNDLKLLNCSNVTIGGLSVTGKEFQVDGPYAIRYHSANLESCGNIFLGTSTFQDNTVTDISGNATVLENLNIYSENTYDTILKFITSANTYCVGGGPSTNIYSGSVYSFQSVDWVVASCSFGGNKNIDTTSTNTTCIGIFFDDPLSQLYLTSTSSNNNGTDDFTKESGGFKFTKSGTTDTIIQVDGCGSVNNLARRLTYSFLSELSNTLYLGCEGCSSEINNPLAPTVGAFGFLLTGSSTDVQENVSVYSSTANDNFSVDNNAYGVYAGKIDYGYGMTQGCKNVVIKNIDANSNSVGIHLEQCNLSSILGNYFNVNDVAGLEIVSSPSVSVISNSAIGCGVGYFTSACVDSDFQKNLASKCATGFLDTTTSGNLYVENKSVGCPTSFVTPSFAIPLFQYNKLLGTYTYLTGENSLTVANVRV